MSSFTERFAKPVDAKEAAQAVLDLLKDPDIELLVEPLKLTKLRGTLAGVASGQITMGDITLAEPLQELLIEMTKPFKTSLFDEARHFITPRGGVLSTRKTESYSQHPHRNDISQEKIALGDGSLPHYVFTDSGNKKFGSQWEENTRWLDKDGTDALDKKITAFRNSVEQVYAAGICVENNPLASKARGHSAA